jgi:hypothetical protein
MAKLRPLEIAKCPFVNLPEVRSGRWGEGLTATRRRSACGCNRNLVAEVEFVEWTPENHLPALS